MVVGRKTITGARSPRSKRLPRPAGPWVLAERIPHGWGKKLGGLNDAGITRRQEATARAEALRPLLAEMEAAEMSAGAIATELNKRRIPTPAGGEVARHAGSSSKGAP